MKSVFISDARMEIRDCLGGSFRDELSMDVLKGLSAPRKYLPSRYFYDGRGSRLFDEICLLPEYYLTRIEMGILTEFSSRIMSSFSRGDIVELGSGSNRKVRALLDAADESALTNMRYVPVDVSRSALVAASRELLDRYKGLRVLGMVADFTRQMDVISEERPKIVVFLGSTLGNFEDEESHGLLRSIAERMKYGDRCIVGLDMVKEKGVIENAYNDAGGVTSEFNKNVLSVINRELGANFDPSGFDHLAFFNEELECVEMHLRANRKARVEIVDVGLVVELAEGETINTEICRKFRRESAESMFARAGLTVTNWYTDPCGWFSLVETAPDGNGTPHP